MTKPIIDGLTAKKLRLSLGLTLDQMGEMLGYSPSPHRKAAVHRIETGEREISPIKARLLTAYRSGYRPEDWPQDVNKPKRKRGSYLHNA